MCEPLRGFLKVRLRVYHSSSFPFSTLQNFILIHPSASLSSLSLTPHLLTLPLFPSHCPNTPKFVWQEQAVAGTRAQWQHGSERDGGVSRERDVRAADRLASRRRRWSTVKAASRPPTAGGSATMSEAAEGATPRDAPIRTAPPTTDARRRSERAATSRMDPRARHDNEWQRRGWRRRSDTHATGSTLRRIIGFLFFRIFIFFRILFFRADDVTRPHTKSDYPVWST